MPKSKTRFQNAWLAKELDGVKLKEWCSATETVFSAKCILCSEIFNISNSGFSQVKAHHKGKKHLQKFQNKSILEAFGGRNLQPKTNISEVLSHDLQLAKAEALWAMKVAKDNMSFVSCNETVELFKEMFPDSAIAAKIQLKEKKVAYVISHGLSKYFEEDLKKDIASSGPGKVTIAFDETTNTQVKRQLDVYLRYWSSEINLVSCRYLTSVFLGHATADILLKEILDVLSSFNISLNRIICVSMDSPNVNKCFLRKFNEVVKQETGQKSLELGFCNLHVVSNAFKFFLTSLNIDFDEFATDMHYFLKSSAARREDYKSVEDITLVTAKFLLRHVSNRWLTVGSVAQRLLDQWLNITEYFLNFLPSQKIFEKQLRNLARYKRIHCFLKNELTPCYLALISFSHQNFEKFSLCYQSEEPKIHQLYSDLNTLMRNVMAQFIEDDVIAGKFGEDLKNVDFENKNSWKKLGELEVGMKTKNLLRNVQETRQKLFLLDVRSSLIATTKYLKSNLPFCNQKLRDIEVLKVKESTQLSVTEGLSEITRISSVLYLSEEQIDRVREEWKLLNCDKPTLDELVKFSEEGHIPVRIDHYWRNIFSIKDSSGKEKYSNLAKVIKSILVLPHGNADAERGFSVNTALLRKDKANLKDSTITSLRIVKGAIKHYGCVSKVPITRNLLNSVRDSHKFYKEYVDKLKEEESKKVKERKQKERENKEKQLEKKRKAEFDDKIKENDAEINRLKKDKEASLAVIQEGTERMRKAVEKQNTVEIAVASNLIIQGSAEMKKTENKLVVVEAEKDRLIRKRLKQ